ncbi:hypothetical protein [Cumulibacter manganitolerans]|uniref:hypothetical protein n=1 Tax=Cumulibacter manganitolerans TaxID=1884992 RepID=UPI00129537F0|nr:hypothetical protein [Cumulibacter manganitolerans]
MSTPTDQPQPSRSTRRARVVRSRRLLIAVGGAIVAAVVAALVIVPRLTDSGPYDSLGPDGSPARAVATDLSRDLTCTAGKISTSHAVLACYRQHAGELAIVFLQSDREGRVSSYTSETRSLTHAEHDHSAGGSEPDSGESVALGNRVAAVVTPGQDFSACTHDSTSAYFCFDSLATWRSTSTPPVHSTGEKKRLPSVDQVDGALAKIGWSCSVGICSQAGALLTVQQPPTGLALQYGGALPASEPKAGITALVGLIKDAPRLAEWSAGLDGTLQIVVADRLVVGYLPEAGGGGLFVVDEVAGVVPGQG